MVLACLVAKEGKRLLSSSPKTNIHRFDASEDTAFNVKNNGKMK